MVLVAPDTYSYGFCIAAASLFLIQNIIYFILRKDRNAVCFESFFAIAFGLTNFIYPIFYFPINDSFSVFVLDFNFSIISYATAVAYFAYSVYLLFLSIVEYKVSLSSESDSIVMQEDFIDYNKLLKQIFLIALMSFMGYLVSGGYASLSSEYQDSGSGVLEKGISPYFYVLFFTSTILIAFLLFKNHVLINAKIFYFVFIIATVLLFLSSGSRTLPLSLVLCLIVSFNNNVKKISFPVFALIVCVGIVILAFIMYTRTAVSDKIGAFNDSDITSIWDFAFDLIINNRNLYTLIDHAHTSGYTYGSSMLGGLLAPIPFAVGSLVSITGIPPEYFTSAGLNTYLELGFNSQWGLGTNLVSDVYLAFGLPGVVFFFGLLGYLIGKAKYLSVNNIYWHICLYIFVSYAVFMVRGGFFDSFRFLIWGLVIVYVFTKFKLKTTDY